MDLRSNRKKQIEKLAKRYNLTLLLLFGSQATGHTHSESDVDVAYLSDRVLSFNEEIGLNTELTQVFQNNQISLVNLKKAPPLLLKQIATRAVVLSESVPHAFEELYLRALRSYEEARPIFDLREHYLKKKVAEYKHAG